MATAVQIVAEALALRASHPHAPATAVLDLVIPGRGLWLEDLFDHLTPPDPFALLVAEAMGDYSPREEWLAQTCPNVDDKVRAAMRQCYAETVLPRFVRRYGYSWLPRGDDAQSCSGWRMGSL